MKSPLASNHRQRSEKETGRISPQAIVGLALMGLILLLGNAFSAPPAWWGAQGVLNNTQNQNNYSAVTVGQLKNMAVKAMNEMDAKLPDGAGPAIHAMVNDWRAHKAEQNQYTAATVGQVKKVSKLFYDRLIAVGARPANPAYPWTTVPTSQNYAIANVGQVKNVFAFAIPALSNPDPDLDSDNDGLADWWEIASYGGLQYGANDMPDGDGIKLSDKYALVKDTDKDGLRDVDEVTQGTNPLWKDHPAVNIMAQGFVFP